MPEPVKRRKKSSLKTNLTAAFIFHVVIFAVAGFWAAHEGVLGKKLQEITVAIIPPEKKPEPEPPKPPPKIEPPKPDIVKAAEPVKPVIAPPPPPQAAPPAQAVTSVAPPPAVLPDFAFSDGAKAVESSTNTLALSYKNMVEYTLRSNWERPEEIVDINYAAEVEIQVDPTGKITGSEWKKGPDDPRWNDSVKKAIAKTRYLGRPPPQGFPGKILVRFDVLPASAEFLPQ